MLFLYHNSEAAKTFKNYRKTTDKQITVNLRLLFCSLKMRQRKVDNDFACTIWKQKKSCSLALIWCWPVCITALSCSVPFSAGISPGTHWCCCCCRVWISSRTISCDWIHFQASLPLLRHAVRFTGVFICRFFICHICEALVIWTLGFFDPQKNTSFSCSYSWQKAPQQSSVSHSLCG